MTFSRRLVRRMLRVLQLDRLYTDAAIGHGSFGIIRKVKRKEDGYVRLVPSLAGAIGSPWCRFSVAKRLAIRRCRRRSANSCRPSCPS